MKMAAAARGEGEKRRFIDIYNGGSCVVVKHRKLFLASRIELVTVSITIDLTYIYTYMTLKCCCYHRTHTKECLLGYLIPSIFLFSMFFFVFFFRICLLVSSFFHHMLVSAL